MTEHTSLISEARAGGLTATDVLSTLPGAATPCQEGDADLWFAESMSDVEAAKAMCRACPVREACLAGALERQEPWGVWGGEVFVDGVVVARKRGRGRPPKKLAQVGAA
ncbi:WhiB family transcriptional regulator [Bogoriella caseilytica]|nr:WhiB family transcriptional regulator [Bogoriella caseilytica]